MVRACERDVEAEAVSFRFLDGSQVNGVPVAQAVDLITSWVADRNNSQPTKDTVAEFLESQGSV